MTEHARPFVVRDPVHGYLSVAAHERLVVDSPITQRLRRIGQTGLAELVFPEAKTSRFVHSLGAMHLASRFVVAAIENADDKEAEDFFGEIYEAVDWTLLREPDLDILLEHSGAFNAFSSTRFSSRVDVASSTGKRNRRLLALVEGALRLAALFHDLGHLPFSHDVEYALQDFASLREASGKPLDPETRAIANAKAPHEIIGHALADIVFRLSTGSEAARHVFSLAKRILDAPEPDYGLFKHQPASALQWLHSLVDGEIDVDRADYLLRDGQALGLDFAQYDLDRLVSNLVLIRTPELGYTTAINEPGLAALESYCLTRSRSHQVFVRHHKVSQVGAALKYASTKLMDTQAAGPLFEVLAKLKKSSNDDEDRRSLLKEYAKLDDGWWFQSLRDLQSSSPDQLLSACLDVALDRAPKLRSLWKRKGDLTPQQLTRLKESESGTLSLRATRGRLVDRGILFTLFRFRPYIEDRATGESVMLIRSKHKQLQPASQLSPLIRHLKDLWEEDIHLFAFAESANSLSIDEVLDLMMEKSK